MSFKESETRDRLCAAVERFAIKPTEGGKGWPKEYGVSYYDEDNDALFFPIGGGGSYHDDEPGFARLIWKDRVIGVEYKDAYFKEPPNKFCVNLLIRIPDDLVQDEDKVIQLAKNAISEPTLSNSLFSKYTYEFPSVKVYINNL